MMGKDVPHAAGLSTSARRVVGTTGVLSAGGKAETETRQREKRERTSDSHVRGGSSLVRQGSHEPPFLSATTHPAGESRQR